jgi:hypothetical protein
MNRRGAVFFLPAFLFFMGAVFIGHALLAGRTGQGLIFALIMGGGFAAFGIALGLIQYVWQKRTLRAGGI